jgi:hypothetical protein
MADNYNDTTTSSDDDTMTTTLDTSSIAMACRKEE